VDEAKKRLARLDEHGPTPFAFTFRVTFPADPAGDERLLTTPGGPSMLQLRPNCECCDRDLPPDVEARICRAAVRD
jgi:hypothetical protein